MGNKITTIEHPIRESLVIEILSESGSKYRFNFIEKDIITPYGGELTGWYDKPNHEIEVFMEAVGYIEEVSVGTTTGTGKANLNGTFFKTPTIITVKLSEAAMNKIHYIMHKRPQGVLTDRLLNAIRNKNIFFEKR